MEEAFSGLSQDMTFEIYGGLFKKKKKKKRGMLLVIRRTQTLLYPLWAKRGLVGGTLGTRKGTAGSFISILRR